NLPGRLKTCPARALKVDAGAVPVLAGEGHRVRVVLGRSGDVVGAGGTPEEMTMLDGHLAPRGRFSHALAAGRPAWIYAVSGSMVVGCQGDRRVLGAGTATTVCAGPAIEVVFEAFEAEEPSHFVVMAGKPIEEIFVKQGPLVMSTMADVHRTLADYASGKF